MNNNNFRMYEFLSGRRMIVSVGDQVRYSSTGIVTSEYGSPVIATVLELNERTMKVLQQMDTDDVVLPDTIGIERIEAVFPKFK